MYMLPQARLTTHTRDASPQRLTIDVTVRQRISDGRSFVDVDDTRTVVLCYVLDTDASHLDAARSVCPDFGLDPDTVAYAGPCTDIHPFRNGILAVAQSEAVA